MSTERELAKTIYVLLEASKTKEGQTKRVIAEEIGRILMEAAKKNIYQTTLILAGLYLDDLEKKTKEQIRNNKGIIYEVEKERLC